MKKRIILIVLALLTCLTLCVTVNADSPVLLQDGAELLTDTEKSEIGAKLRELSDKYDVDFAVVTFASTGDNTADDLTVDYYNLAGIGEGREGGILFLIAMEDEIGGRAYRIHTRGLAEEAMTADQQVGIGETAAEYLSDGEYADAIDVFLDESEYYINGEINGYPFNSGRNLVISLVIGLIIAFIVTGMWKGQLKSVIRQHGAKSYTKDGSLNVTFANEFFIYRTVSRSKKSSDSSSSGRSSSGGGRTTGGSF